MEIVFNKIISVLLQQVTTFQCSKLHLSTDFVHKKRNLLKISFRLFDCIFVVLTCHLIQKHPLLSSFFSPPSLAACSQSTLQYIRRSLKRSSIGSLSFAPFFSAPPFLYFFCFFLFVSNASRQQTAYAATIK